MASISSCDPQGTRNRTSDLRGAAYTDRHPMPCNYGARHYYRPPLPPYDSPLFSPKCLGMAESPQKKVPRGGITFKMHTNDLSENIFPTKSGCVPLAISNMVGGYVRGVNSRPKLKTLVGARGHWGGQPTCPSVPRVLARGWKHANSLAGSVF